MAPLPPLPENNTPRLFVRWQGPEGPKETVFRFADGDPLASMVATARAICTAAAFAVQSDTQANGARYQRIGESVSFPVEWGGAIVGLATSFAKSMSPGFMSATGRSFAGRRVRITIPYVTVSTDATTNNDYRWLPGEVPGVTEFLASLGAVSAPPVAKDGGLVVWNQYVNVGLNAYYQRKQRRS